MMSFVQALQKKTLYLEDKLGEKAAKRETVR